MFLETYRKDRRKFVFAAVIAGFFLLLNLACLFTPPLDNPFTNPLVIPYQQAVVALLAPFGELIGIVQRAFETIMAIISGYSLFKLLAATLKSYQEYLVAKDTPSIMFRPPGPFEGEQAFAEKELFDRSKTVHSAAKKRVGESLRLIAAGAIGALALFSLLRIGAALFA